MRSVNVVLMTATIQPGEQAYLTLKDPGERWRQYRTAFHHWINNSAVSAIVFCENSGYEVDYGELVAYGRAQGKAVEILTHKHNRDASLYGKGYAEGQLMEFALKTSNILQTSRSVFKVTGRLYVRNFVSVAQSCSRAENVFSCLGWSGKSKAVDTRFFKITPEFYRKTLLLAYRGVDDNRGQYLEHQFHDALRGLAIEAFRIHPWIVGQSASTREQYSTGLVRHWFQNIAGYAGLYRVR